MAELAKAQLIELVSQGNNWVEGNKKVTVQFNPSSLKVSYANQLSGGDQAGGSPKQFVGSSTTKMSLELWFDATDDQSDVRVKTQDVAYFIKPRDVTEDNKPKKIPPRVRFSWGSFLFDGMVDSLDENLEFFSEAGVPMRASVSLALSEQAFQFAIKPGIGGGAPSAGTTPTATARAGDSVQGIAGRLNLLDAWQKIASANGIDDPRKLVAGTPLRTRL